MADSLSVLILEDNDFDAELIVYELQKSWRHLRWIVVDNEKEYAAYLDADIDLVIADFSLPQFDALSALAQLQKKGLDIPFIVVTGAIDDEKAAECMKRGASDYLLKDRLARLNSAVSQAIQKKALKQESIRAEEDKKESEQRLADTIEFLPDATMVIDIEGRITTWNRAMEEMTGVKAGEIVGKGNFEYSLPFYSRRRPILIDLVLHPDSGIEKKYPRLIREGDCLISESDVPDLRGRRRYLWAKARPIYNTKGELIGAIESLRDITERKDLEENLRDSSRQLQKAIERTIQVMATIVEIRDPYTAGHEKRVSCLASAIAVEMGLSEKEIQGIRMSALIHDVGKIYVPAEILSKPTRLKDIEFKMIKIHTQAGFEILKDIEFPWPVAEVVHQHHERIDGSGYPAGLKDDQILLDAKIVAVADVVEAMATHRPYRPALGIEKALDEISLNKGVCYDRDAVTACVRLFEESRFSF